jgi:hypothetical protein
MIRALVVPAAVCLTTLAASAADDKVDSAVATFKSVAGDAGKLKIFCEMSAVMDKAGDNPDAAAEAQIEGYVKELGPDFETAWDAGDGIDEDSADGKKLNAALDELGDKCSG